MALKKKEKDKLKAMLLEERQQIVDNLKKIESDSSFELSQASGDSMDIASVEISQAALNKLGKREQKLLHKIEIALNKFETGDYGICELTGEDIPLERLMARPVAQYTVEAKEQLERQERRFRDSSLDDDEFSASFDEFE